MRNIALITGSSEGLGKAFALELASRGTALMLVSLPDTGLPELSCFIRKNYCTWVDYIEMDLTVPGISTELFKQLNQKELAVQILINNAGIGNWSWFGEKNDVFYKKQIELNITTPVILTRLFLSQASNLDKAYLLNVGSLGGVFVVPKKQVYGATKSFIRHFTQSLRLELYGSHVSVSLLSPGGINTKPELLVFNNNLKGISRHSILEPEQVAKTAIDGMLKGKKEIIPGRINSILFHISKLIPDNLKEYMVKRQVLSMQ